MENKTFNDGFEWANLSLCCERGEFVQALQHFIRTPEVEAEIAQNRKEYLLTNDDGAEMIYNEYEMILKLGYEGGDKYIHLPLIDEYVLVKEQKKMNNYES